MKDIMVTVDTEWARKMLQCSTVKPKVMEIAKHGTDEEFLRELFEFLCVPWGIHLKEQKELRTKLTDEEYHAISHLTRETKLDSVFDVDTNKNGEDCFRDFENDCLMSLKDGLEELYEAMAYPLKHEGLSEEECTALVNLFREFEVGDEEGYEHLLSETDDYN